MPKIAVIGAGDVGTTIGYTLQVSGLATEIVLTDINQKLAHGQIMDMNHGLFFVPPVQLRAGDYSDCRGADVVIITAGARQKTGESRIALVERAPMENLFDKEDLDAFIPAGLTYYKGHLYQIADKLGNLLFKSQLITCSDRDLKLVVVYAKASSRDYRVKAIEISISKQQPA